MFDVKSIDKQYFKVKLYITDDTTEEVKEELEINVAPPKLKTLKKIISLGKNSDDDSLYEVVRIILDKNKEHIKVPDEFIGDMEYTEMLELYNKFFEWLNNTHNSKN